MDVLLGRLTNLGYEFFGIIVAGFLVGLFLAVPTTTFSAAVSSADVQEFYQQCWSLLTGKETTTAALLLIVAGALVASYLTGHFLKWFAKVRFWNPRQPKALWLRFLALVVEVRGGDSYSKGKHEILFVEASRFLGLDAEWNGFYMVAKTFLAHRGGYSLVSTYQNKYTLHRSLAKGLAVAAWVALCGSIACFVARDPKLASLCFVETVVFCVGVAMFSKSYSYYWTLFGDALVVEVYSWSRQGRQYGDEVKA